MTQQWPDAFRTEGVPDRSVVVAIITGETLDPPGVTKSELTAGLCVVRPVCRAVKIEYGTRFYSIQSDDGTGITISEDVIIPLSSRS